MQNPQKSPRVRLILLGDSFNGQTIDASFLVSKILREFILPEYRRKGILSQTLPLLENFARTQGLPKVKAEVLRKHRASRAVHVKAGFKLDFAKTILLNAKFMRQERNRKPGLYLHYSKLLRPK